MGFIHRKTSKQTTKFKNHLKIALSRLTIARCPRLVHKLISHGDVGQLLTRGHLDRALHHAEQVIEEDNMLEAHIIELHCKCLIEHTTQLDRPLEYGEETREAAGGIIFAAGWCGDLPELLFARTILTDKFSADFTEASKEDTCIVNPILVWKLSRGKTNMELKKKVTKEIAIPSSRKQLSKTGMAEVICTVMESTTNFDRKAWMKIQSQTFGRPSPHRNIALALESTQENPCGISNSSG